MMSVFTASARPDSLQYVLDSTVFVSLMNKSGIKGKATQLNMNSGLVSSLPRVFGSVDPLRLVQYLPGVQTNAEYDNGIRIQGCDNAHNFISLDGVPVYSPTHLFGLFSVFNNAHFNTTEFDSNAMSPNRLGGAVTMRPGTSLHAGVEGDFETGLISSQGAISFPLGKKCEVGIAARRSYLNLLYGRFLIVDGNPLKYSFGDFDLSFLWEISDTDKIWAEGYFGRDGMNYRYAVLSADFYVSWGNVLAGLNWKHKWSPGFVMTHKFYWTGFNVGLNLKQDLLSVSMPSNIATFGYSGRLTVNEWNIGLDLQAHRAMPQCPNSPWIPVENTIEIQHASENSLWVSKMLKFDSGFSINAMAKVFAYVGPESEWYLGLSPFLQLSYDFHRFGVLSARCGTQSQFLFQTGVSNTGMPLEFYFLAGNHCGPQKAINMELNHDVSLFRDAVSLSATLFYKRLNNQIEYYGTLLDLIVKPYSLDDAIVIGSGNNYGASIMARKNSGMLTGWLSYSLGRSLRHFESGVLRGTFPSSHERIHQLNMVANYRLGCWEMGGTFVLASGTPFTAPKSYYLYGEQLISENSEFNGARMPAYIRLDLSANWYIHSGPGMENGINLSIYNVLCRRNSMCCRMNVYKGQYGYSSMSIPMLFMPSVGYFHRF